MTNGEVVSAFKLSPDQPSQVAQSAMTFKVFRLRCDITEWNMYVWIYSVAAITNSSEALCKLCTGF